MSSLFRSLIHFGALWLVLVAFVAVVAVLLDVVLVEIDVAVVMVLAGFLTIKNGFKKFAPQRRKTSVTITVLAMADANSFMPGNA